MSTLPKTRTLYEHGSVTLEKVMGDDVDILNNAKVSFNKRTRLHYNGCLAVHESRAGCTCTELDPCTRLTKQDQGILNFLMRERHGSPWEAPVFRFTVRAPICVNREWFRHRIGSFNEESLRYSEATEEFYVPAREDVRSQVGKPGAYSFETIEDDEVANRTIRLFMETQQNSINAYHEMLDMGVAKELARNVLSVGMFSSFVWTVNLRALFNFLELRNHEHALREIRAYAAVVEELASAQLPYAFELFNKHGRKCP